MDADAPVQSIETAPRYLMSTGSTWVTRYNGERWPVVLCDETLPPEALMQTRRGRERPAILLGKLIFIWVHDDLLSEYIPDPKKEPYLDGHPRIPEAQLVDSAGEEAEQLRQTAFFRDAVDLRDDKFWYNHMVQMSETRKLERQKAQGEGRKRSDTVTEDVRTPKRKANDIYSGTSQYPSSTLHMTNLTKRAKFNDIYDSADSDEGAVFLPPGSTRNTATGDLVTQNGRKALKQDAKVLDRDYICEILVGRSRKSVLVNQYCLENCTYLWNLQRKNNYSGGTVIDLTAEYPTITTKAFEFVFNYINVQAIDAGGADLALAFSAASKLQYKVMQESILERLKALRPLDLSEILDIAGMCRYMPIPETLFDNEFADWISDQIVDKHGMIVTEQGGRLEKVLVKDYYLRQAVKAKLAKGSTAGKSGL